MKEYESLLQNQPVDVSEQFTSQHNHYFVGSAIREFDTDQAPGGVSGEILWKGISLKQRVSYHQITLEFEDYKVWRDTPQGEYDDQQALPFSLSFVSPRCVRLRCAARAHGIRDEPSLMLAGSPR